MRRPRHIVIDGKPCLWRDLLTLRRAQCVEPKDKQPTLFPLEEDARPVVARTAAGRYREPSLFDEASGPNQGMVSPPSCYPRSRGIPSKFVPHGVG
jgi:hypothetical protein